MATMSMTEAEAFRDVLPPLETRPKPRVGKEAVLSPWLRSQAINVTRHAAALRPFRPDEFGSGAEAPTAGHTQAVNNLISALRRGLLQMSAQVRRTAVAATQEESTARLQDL